MGKGIMLYDFLAVRGGAEKLALTLLKALPDVPLAVGYRDGSSFSAADLPAGGCIDLRAYSKIPAWRILKIMHAFERRTSFLRGYDWVLFSGVYAPLAVHQHPHGANLLYCHTIPRFAYDLQDYYLRQFPWYLRPAFLALVYLMRFKYARALAKMDLILANSANVKRRIERYLGHTAVVVHPPIDIERFRWLGEGDYYVSLARLENFKRVDLIVEAFLRMPERKLVVLSGGAEYDRLVRLAQGADNIRFLGWQPEAEMQAWIGSCRAAIYVPIDEDFGMSPVEAMAAGKPVIGVAEGGLLETIVDGETGVLISGALSPDSLIAAVERLESLGPVTMRSACEARARQFSEQVFIDKMQNLLASMADAGGDAE